MQYYCPSCGKETVRDLESTKNVQYCSCGMVWMPLTSSLCYNVNTDVRSAIKDVLNETLQIYYTKNEEINQGRERHKAKTVEYLTDEILKGPIQGGTMANPESICELFGTGLWPALQKAILIRDKDCMICGLKPSQEVHHIRPRHLKGHDHPRNLIGLCLDCHDEVHRKIDKGIQTVCESSLQIPVSKFQTTLDVEESQ